MSWRWDDNHDKNDVDAGVIVAISAGVIALAGIVVAVVERISPENMCFRFLDRILCWIPFAAFFVMAAISMITATSADPGSTLPVGIAGSCFLAWAALVAFVVWRARKVTLANIRAGRNPLGGGTVDNHSIVFAVPVGFDTSGNDNDCGLSHGNTIDTYASELQSNPGDSGFYSAMACGGLGGDYDGGSSGFSSSASGDSGGASSSTGDSGGGGY